MKNIKAKISSKNENKLILTIDISKKGTESQSGKSIIIAKNDGRFESLDDIEGMPKGYGMICMIMKKKGGKKKKNRDEDEGDDD